MNKIIHRIFTAWYVLTSNKYWVFTKNGNAYWERMNPGKPAWTTNEARQMVKSVHKKAYSAIQQESAVDEAQKIANEGRNSL